jgi:cyclophilin family peptidyl-prolyl cis-trans isomerase
MKRLKSKKSDSLPRPALMQPLEGRKLMSVTITSAVADNRGEVTLTVGGQADPATVSRRSVLIYTPGDDGILNTADDVKETAPVRYYPSAKRIVIRGNLAPNTPYRVKIVAARMTDLDGEMLDGDFKGASVASGNGKAGGNYEFFADVDDTTAPLLRMSTSLGNITYKLFRSVKPNSVGNFLYYTDHGAYDNIFWTRSLPGFIIQAGALQLNNDNVVVPIQPTDPVENEFDDNAVISNTRGTLALAKLPGDPDSATSEFFVNLADNGGTPPYGLDFQNGGFTVFGRVLDQASLDVVDKIAALPTVALWNPVTDQGQLPMPDEITLTDVPVTTTEHLDGEVQAIEQLPAPYPSRTQFVVRNGIDVPTETVTIRRTTMLMSITSTASRNDSKPASVTTDS